jgi:DNA-binding MarR family transcriptional regulator
MAKTVVELIAAWASYEEQNSNAGIEEFCRFYLAGREAPEKDVIEHPKRPLDAQLNRLVGRMSRWSAYYSRRLLLSFDLSGPEEFVFLGSINELGEVRKSEVIQQNVYEFKTGMTILQQLKNKGWTEEIIDPADRKGTRVRLTLAGQEVYHKAIPVMLDVGNQLFRNLDDHEKSVLKSLLIKAESLQRYG